MLIGIRSPGRIRDRNARTSNRRTDRGAPGPGEHEQPRRPHGRSDPKTGDHSHVDHPSSRPVGTVGRPCSPWSPSTSGWCSRRRPPARWPRRPGAKAAAVESRHEAKLERIEARHEAKLARLQPPTTAADAGADLGHPAASIPARLRRRPPPRRPPRAPVVIDGPDADHRHHDRRPRQHRRPRPRARRAAPAPRPPPTRCRRTSPRPLQALYTELMPNGTTPSCPGARDQRQRRARSASSSAASTGFDAALAQLQSDGMQVSTSSANYGLIEGMLPISALPRRRLDRLERDPGIAPLAPLS